MSNLEISNIDIKNSIRQSHRWLLSLNVLLFFTWSIFDFYNSEPMAPLYFLARIMPILFSVFLASQISHKLFSKQYDIITCIILGSISLMNTYIILNNESSHLIHIAFQTLLYLTTAMLLQSKTRYYLGIIVPPIFLLFFSKHIIVETHQKDIFIISVYAILFSLVCTVFHYNMWKYVTRFYKTKEDFEMTRHKIENLNNENNQLIRILCHDLGNALTIVEMSTTLISENIEIKEEQSKFFEKNMSRIKRAINNQKEIIEHVKEKEAIESGKQKIELSPVSLNIIFEKVKFIFSKKLKEKNINLVITYGSDKSPYVMAELVSLSNNVINNIVSNAIKFCPDNSEIIITTWSDKNLVYITIEDFGIGMPEIILKNIFSSSAQTSRPGVNGEKGTGFGMPLAKCYMSQYNGEIFVESREGKGTRFTLKFRGINEQQLLSKDLTLNEAS